MFLSNNCLTTYGHIFWLHENVAVFLTFARARFRVKFFAYCRDELWISLFQLTIPAFFVQIQVDIRSKVIILRTNVVFWSCIIFHQSKGQQLLDGRAFRACQQPVGVISQYVLLKAVYGRFSQVTQRLPPQQLLGDTALCRPNITHAIDLN